MSVVRADRSWRALFDPGSADDLFAFTPPAFPLVPARFDRATGRFLAELARMIYQREPDRRRPVVARAGLLEAAFVESGPVGAGCYVAASGGLGTVLVFRGTTSLGGWMTNIDVRRAPASIGGRVHRGFLDAWLHAAATVRACVAALPPPLIVTGHSLGGALAVLAAIELDAATAYTFGAPRVGDAEFARGFARRAVFRVTNGRDVVATLPPGPLFRHVGKPRRIGSSLALRAGQLVREAARAIQSGRLEELRANLREAPEPLSDHAPVNYVRGLAP